MGIEHDALSFSLLESDPHRRPTATKDFRAFKAMATSVMGFSYIDKLEHRVRLRSN